eukprot:CAMPEP_0198249346 /NCGR_PEP_ID=MMETSP1447-20131203/904_1 /TAXON_ID=420782 /ORGANISM="Chaetoceros dichaeta, Strain CCMP1751" /LENGTH=407 /DNA_ID=CAMNT_0043933959 /DNA_START=74 /DNA_END=1297 /DNA_ORIENTATION=-
MSKRRSENGQIGREELEETNERNAPTMGRFNTASKDQMKDRRIRRVDRKWKPAGGSTGNTIQPPSAAGKQPTLLSRVAAVNPFANTKLPPTKASSMMFGNSLGTVNKPSMTNTVLPTNMKITPLPITGVEGRLNEAQKLNLSMTRLSQFEWNNRSKGDWSLWLTKYVTKMEALKKDCSFETEEDDDEQSGTKDSSNGDTDVRVSQVIPAFKTTPLVSESTKPMQPSSTLMFGMPSNTPPAAAAPPKPFSGFSFAAGPVVSAATPAIPDAPLNSSTTETGDEISKDETTKIEVVTNEEEEELYLCRAKYRKFIKTESIWKDFSAGKLRLCRHKTKKTHYLTLRNEYGSVQLNLAISKGMTFKKVPKKKIGSIQFVAVQDSAIGFESFVLVVRPDHLDKLHDTLEEMAK